MDEIRAGHDNVLSYEADGWMGGYLIVLALSVMAARFLVIPSLALLTTFYSLRLYNLRGYLAGYWLLSNRDSVES